MEFSDRIGRRMKLHDIHVLMAVVQTGSMGKAAALLNTTQSAISRSIADLESTMGVRLLDRSSQGVEPTTYGNALLKRSIAVFDELRQSVKDIEFLADPGVGEVRTGSTGPLAASFVSIIIDRLHRRYPRMVFHIVTGNAASLQRDLDERNFDLLILRKIGPYAEDRLNFEVLYDNPYFVAAGAKSPWARRRHVKLADLIDEMWVLPPAGTRFGMLARDIFGAKGLPCPRAAVISSGIEMTINLLGTGRYLAIHPESVFTFPVKHPFIRKLPIELPTVSGPIGILTLKNRALSPAAQLFIDCARAVAKPLGRRK